MIKEQIMDLIHILSKKYLKLAYIYSSCIVHYVHNVKVRLGEGWGRNGYHVTKGLAELIVFFLLNYEN